MDRSWRPDWQPTTDTGNLPPASPCQAIKRFLIFLGGLFDDLRRERRRRWGFIPIERLKIVANELFVVTERADADLVRVGRPKA